jgi:DNA replication protein DnaD
MSGWIKLHRQIRNHWVFKNANYFKAWVVIISEVNHQSTKVIIEGELIECKRGQSINSLSTWVSILGKDWTIQKLRTFLKLLEKDEMINTEGLRKTTRLTVCNYDSYQSEQQGDNKQTTNRQQGDNKEITTNKNVKKEKK